MKIIAGRKAVWWYVYSAVSVRVKGLKTDWFLVDNKYFFKAFDSGICYLRRILGGYGGVHQKFLRRASVNYIPLVQFY